jgi:site-specific recombinase XerD
VATAVRGGSVAKPATKAVPTGRAKPALKVVPRGRGGLDRTEFEDAFAAYLAWHESEGRKPSCIRWHRENTARFGAWLAHSRHPTIIGDVTADHLRSWSSEQQKGGERNPGKPLSQKTVSGRVKAVRAFFAWLAEEEWLPANPMARVKPPQVDEIIKPHPSPTDVDALLRACGDPLTGKAATLNHLRDRAILVLLYSTGLRASEVTGMLETDVNFRTGLVQVRGKGGTAATVALGGPAHKAVARYLRDPRRQPHQDGNLFLTDEREPMTYATIGRRPGGESPLVPPRFRQRVRRGWRGRGVAASAAAAQHARPVAPLLGVGQARRQNDARRARPRPAAQESALTGRASAPTGPPPTDGGGPI